MDAEAKQLLMEQNFGQHITAFEQGGANTLEKLASLDEAIIQGILAECDESSKTTSWKTKSRARLLLKAIREARQRATATAGETGTTLR